MRASFPCAEWWVDTAGAAFVRVYIAHGQHLTPSGPQGILTLEQANVLLADMSDMPEREQTEQHATLTSLLGRVIEFAEAALDDEADHAGIVQIGD